MATKQHNKIEEMPESADIDVTAAEWLMIIVTGFTGVFAGPFALIPGAVLLGMFTYRVNPELMRNTRAAEWVRGLLPAPATDNKLLEDKETGSAAQSVPQTPTAANVGKVATPAKQLEMIDVPTLASYSTILLVGSRGSGKSTLLRALLAARKDSVFMHDPHAAPDDWPMAAMTYNTYPAIGKALLNAQKRLDTRLDERRAGIKKSGWPPFTLAGDEWGSIVNEVTLPEKKEPGAIIIRLLKEGRKVGINFIAGAHGDTIASLGSKGDSVAFLNSFDWLIYMGGFVADKLEKQYADVLQNIPMGRNEQGGRFPLIVVAYSPTTRELRLLDMRGLDAMVYNSTAKAAPVMPWQAATNDGTTSLLAGMMSESPSDSSQRKESPSDMRVTAAQSEVTYGDSVTSDIPTPQEIAQIAMSLSLGKTPSQAAKAMKGCNSRKYQALLAKAEYVKRLLEDATVEAATPAPEVATVDEDEGD